jgi:hypothetical protein
MINELKIIKTQEQATVLSNPEEFFLQSHYYIDDNLFSPQKQPLAPIFSVQLRIPSKYGKQIYDASNGGFTIIDENYLGKQKLNIIKDEDEYWVDLTKMKEDLLTIATTNYNNFIQSIYIEDVGGKKGITVELSDRNWGNIEDLLTLALQVSNFDSNGEIWERDPAKPIQTGTETNKDESGKEKTTPIMSELGINQILLNADNITNIRVKIGYSNPTEIFKATSSNFLPSSENNFDNFKLRKEEEILLESPWIEGMIIKIERNISEGIGKFKIEAVGIDEVILNRVQIVRQFAILRTCPINALRIVKDIRDVYVQAKLFLKNKAAGATLSQSENISQDTDEHNTFHENYYNPKYSLPYTSKEEDILSGTKSKVFESNETVPFEVKDSILNPWGADFPNRLWAVINGSVKASVFDYWFLEEPAEQNESAPLATLGSILSEMLSFIPPRRYIINNQTSEILALEDKHEKALVENSTKKAMTVLQEQGLITGKTSDWDFSDYQSNYRYMIQKEKSDKEDSTKTENRLVFYYPSVIGNKKPKQKKIRMYKYRSNNSLVKKFTTSEDSLSAILMGSVKRTLNDETFNTGKKVINQQGVPSADLEKEVAETVKDTLLTDFQISNAKTTSNNTFSVGRKNLKTPNDNYITTIAKNITNKATLEIFGDPFFFFDKKIRVGEYMIYLQFFRPNMGLFQQTIGISTGDTIDPFYSGYYTITSIKHNINNSGYTTTLELIRLPGDVEKSFDK